MAHFRLVIKNDLGFEVWQDIPNYEGLYQASTYGRIKSLITNKILKPCNCRGYSVLMVRKNGKTIPIKVHRAVGITFLPTPPKEKNCINHRDEIKNNNRVENLEWCDVAYNNVYNGKINKILQKRKKKVKQYTIDGVFLQEFDSAKEAAEKCNCTRELIQYACTGKIKTAKNFKWSY